MRSTLPSLNDCTVAVIGLGYVGLPLAVEFAKPQACRRTGVALRRRVIGFDINSVRLEELRHGTDRTNEISAQELKAATNLDFTNDSAQLAEADVFVVTVPTPIDSAKRPDLTPLEMASVTVGQALKQRNSATTPMVIYESTVYPGATEEVCVPIVERESGLRYNAPELGEGFFCGYSPAASIKVAEAAKVIENTQRDLNIALVNELAIIFRQLRIDTLDVLEAAGTKWNFLPFRPGLVGGHCIGVDPYYLTHKAEQLGYYPHLVLAGRRINDGMGRWIVEQIVLEMVLKKMFVGGAKVLLLGIAFKENCPDLRNTRVVDVLEALSSYGMDVVVVDPWVDPDECLHEYGVAIEKSIPANSRFQVVIAAVAHLSFVEMNAEEWKSLIDDNGILADLKGIMPRSLNAFRI